MSKRRSWDETGSSYDHKFACSDNLGQTFGTKLGNPIKLDRVKKFGYQLWPHFWMLLQKFNLDLHETIEKLQSIVTKITWKLFFCSIYLEWRFKILEKALICLKNLSSIKKLAISNVESFLKPNLDLIKILQILVKQNH